MRQWIGQARVVVKDRLVACQSDQTLGDETFLGWLFKTSGEPADATKLRCEKIKANGPELPSNDGATCWCTCSRGGLTTVPLNQAPQSDCDELVGRPCDPTLTGIKGFGSFGLVKRCYLM
jgi:hypothetical protein